MTRAAVPETQLSFEDVEDLVFGVVHMQRGRVAVGSARLRAAQARTI